MRNWICAKVTFGTSFDDLPLECIDETIQRSSIFVSAKPQQSFALDGEKDDSAEVKTDTMKTFEEQLSNWLLDRLCAQGEVVGSIEHGGAAPEYNDSSSTTLTNFLHKIQKNIVNCLLFIKQTGATDYVHSIQLGAKFPCLHNIRIS